MRVRRRRDLLAAAGLAVVAVGTGVVALGARGNGGTAHLTRAPQPVLAGAPSTAPVGVAPGVTGAGHAGAAIATAPAVREALARNGVALQSVGTAGRTAVLLKALAPRRVPVTHVTVPKTVVAAARTSPATATYTTPVQTATPTYTAPVQTAPTYTAPPAPAPTPSPAPSSGAGSSGGGSGIASGGG